MFDSVLPGVPAAEGGGGRCHGRPHAAADPDHHRLHRPGQAAEQVHNTCIIRAEYMSHPRTV